MKCPVCGEDCVSEASDLLDSIPAVFSPCPDCPSRILDKNVPPPSDGYRDPCRCGRRFIDEVYAHLYTILVSEGVFSGKEPLKAVGTPLVHPGFPMTTPPYLPPNSLVLLCRPVEKSTAHRIIREVPEVRAVIKSDTFIPGVVDPDLAVPPKSYELLAGCDIRANIFPSRAGPVVLYQQQSAIHIEFPRLRNPKIESVEREITRMKPEWFVDALCGIGKLGLVGARMGIPHVVMNDAWYAAAFFAAYNTLVNREFFNIEGVRILADYRKMAERPVVREPQLIAETEGVQEIRVYQGDFRHLPTHLPPVPVLAALDIFEKRDPVASAEALRIWREQVIGEAFIP
jgi:hypothetical protein